MGFAQDPSSSINLTHHQRLTQIHQLQKPQGPASRAAEASAMTASHGNLPVAASPLSITASVPSQTAFLGTLWEVGSPTNWCFNHLNSEFNDT